MSDPVVFYVCAKCNRKTLSFHMVTGGRIVCHPCNGKLRKFVEQYETENAPK